ncbi:TetR family transcriptional regulator [Arthrobacter psychrolactophilus]|uniref:TetR family transcriptional regulator n=2 Tax=Arthrobacter psychrolactophilus TaxID=92442 RepID=A0A2V5ILX7_9MICC|nr:TetR family transcriptional regulator [Arthrobacter psychrolactophilus]
MRLFWERGYELTSINDLTRELGISAPSLYAAFGDKQALFDEAVARYEASPQSVTTAGKAGTSQREVLRAMFDRAVQEYASTAHPRGCLVNSEPKLEANRTQNCAITAARLREVAESAEMNNDADTLAAFAQVMLVGLSSYARDGANKEQLQRVAELALCVMGSPQQTEKIVP